MEANQKATDHVAGFIDIGTNAIRLLVVRINANLSYTVISQEKEVVRLGEQEFKDGILREEAMERAILVCGKFVNLSRTYGASKIVSVGTSAMREAKNQQAFLERLKAETGLDVKVISGEEEARLVWLGVSSGIDIGDRKAIFLDLGGGSTEIAIGNQYECFSLNTLRLGAIRLTSEFIGEDWTAPVPPDTFKRMKKHASQKIASVKERVLKYGVRLAYGSSGTMVNLAEISNKLFKKNGNGDDGQVITRKNLKRLSPLLCSLSLEERRKLPAINPERADIIIAGAAVVEAIMEDLGLEEIHISHRSLHNGLLVEYLSGFEGFRELQRSPMRSQSVLRIGRSCNYDEKHSEAVSVLALQLFDSAKRIGLHSYGGVERELLRYAATLHDVGDFLSFNDHHLHSQYIIENAELPGFDRREIVIMGLIARYHRKKAPSRKVLKGSGLDDESKALVVVLSAFLRFAEKLDRSHCGLVSKAEFVDEGDGRCLLLFYSDSDCSFEEWSIAQNKRAFSDVFERQLDIHCNVATVHGT